MPTRRATATWEGDKTGSGNFQGEGGAIGGNYSFARFAEEGGGTNPEELLAAANASCYSMALAAGLEAEGAKPERVETRAACTIEKSGDGFKITRMRLTVRARVPGVDEETFRRIAEAKKSGCPVSAALQGNVEFELDAQLEQ